MKALFCNFSSSEINLERSYLGECSNLSVLVAQLVEHKAENFGVAGSSPV
jgi:hypothetical protein